jgi:hypothetical protein
MGEELHLSGNVYDLFSVLAAVTIKRRLLDYNSVQIGERSTGINGDISQQTELPIFLVRLRNKIRTSSGTFEAFLSLSS